MELTNELYDRESQLSAAVMQEVLQGLTRLLSPFSPHLAEELWETLGQTAPVLDAQWPSVDEALAAEDNVQVVVQVNGKLRDRLSVPKGLPKEQLSERARELERISSLLQGKTVRKVIEVPDRLVNFVVG